MCKSHFIIVTYRKSIKYSFKKNFAIPKEINFLSLSLYNLYLDILLKYETFWMSEKDQF